MRKILPINKHPYLRSYTHHGYFHSIISAEDKVVIDESISLADFTINDFSSYKWDNQSGRVTYTETNGNFKIYGNRWNLDLNITFWRDCKEEDEVEVFIGRQLYINPWSSITLFLTDLYIDMLDIDNFLIRVGNFSKDGIYYDLKSDKYTIVNKHGIGRTIKLYRRKNNVFMQYKDGKDKYDEIKIAELAEGIEYKIGFSAALGNNSYFEWLFSNYINIYGDFDNAIFLDFICNRKKDWSPHTSDYFIDYDCESVKDIRQLGFTELDYIKKMIDMGRYVEVNINDNLNDGITDENGAYFHQNLIYGYDSDDQSLFLLYYDYGIVKESTMSFDLYCSARNYQLNKKYYTYKYNPGYEHFDLSAEYFLRKYIDFRDSIYISINENVTGKEHIFGLDCYRRMLSTEVFSAIINDLRISHLLHERSICNKNRLEYLIAKGILHTIECKNLANDLNKQYKYTSILKGLILKNQINGNVEAAKIQSYLASIVDLEVKITDEMINVLSNAI